MVVCQVHSIPLPCTPVASIDKCEPTAGVASGREHGFTVAPGANNVNANSRAFSTDQRQFMKGLGVPRHSSGERVADASSWLRPYQQSLPLTPKGSSHAAEALYGGFEDKDPPHRAHPAKSTNEPVASSALVELLSTVASSWDAGQTTGAGLSYSDPRSWRLGSRWSSDIRDGVDASTTA